MSALGDRLTYANVAATLGVLAALSGGAYAASQLPPNSVRSSTIRNGQVKRVDLGGRAVTAAKIRNRSLTRKDVKRRTLPVGPAGDRGAAGTPGVAGAVGPVSVGNHLIRLDGGPQTFGPGVSTIVMKGATWTQKAGATDAAISRVDLQGTGCASGQYFRITTRLDGGAALPLVDFVQADQTNYPGLVPVSLPPGAGASSHALVVEADNGCGADFTISRLDIDMLELG